MLSFYLTFLLLIITTIAQSKIYDCFSFFNEVELLKVRLDELYDSVDYFVLVESVETHRGNPKTLYFSENKHLFQPYLDKIIHIVLDEYHPEMGLWTREHHQRESIKNGLTHCTDEDI